MGNTLKYVRRSDGIQQVFLYKLFDGVFIKIEIFLYFVKIPGDLESVGRRIELVALSIGTSV
jgi:hypothetical protein